MIAERFRAFLIADTTARTGGLTCKARLSPYDSGPAGDGLGCFVLTDENDRAPSGAWLALKDNPSRFIVLIQEQGGTPWDFRSFYGIEARVSVKVFGVKGPSDKALCDMAFDLHRLFHHAEVTVPGFDQWGCWADGVPAEAKDPDGFPGYQFECRIKVVESASTTVSGTTTP